MCVRRSSGGTPLVGCRVTVLDGDSAVAQAHYARLPPADQEQMKLRCARYGITFVDKP